MPIERSKNRDLINERRERLRYEVLRGLYERTSAPGKVATAGTTIARELDVSRESLFQAILFLAHKGYVRYEGAGPRVSMTQMGIDYLTRDAQRRHSIRE